MKTKTLSNRLPWPSILESSRRRETPWRDVSSSILTSIEQLDLDQEDLGNGITPPMETIDAISQLLDRQLQEIDKMSYYQKISMRFSVFQSLVGVLVKQAMEMDQEGKEEMDALKQIAHVIVLCSIRQIPFTIELWRMMIPQLIPEARPILEDILFRVEQSIMTITGNTVYNYFNDNCSRSEVDRLLDKAYRAILSEDKTRQYTERHGDGHTKLLMRFIFEWQDEYQLKKMNSIMPFLKSLDAHWRHSVSLGCRQGIEKMYKAYWH